MTLLKALADENRLLILEMLSCGEMCACDIMDRLELTQPTISHHMKILQQSKLVEGRKGGKWVFYSINRKTIKGVQDFLKGLVEPKENCICEEAPKQDCD